MVGFCVICGAACSNEVVALEGGAGSPCTPPGGGVGKRCEIAPGELACVSTSDAAYGCANVNCFPCVAPQVSTAVCRSNGTCGIGACFQGFNDCDAQYPNGCEVNLNEDVRHCGSCDTDCNAYLPAKPGVFSLKCSLARCEVATCEPGRLDCDGALVNGCETVAPPDQCMP
jgi:hypothetical protein